MSEKDKSVEENSLDEELSLNEPGEDSDVSDDSQDEVENVGTPTYEELVDKKEELEGLLLRANAVSYTHLTLPTIYSV